MNTFVSILVVLLGVSILAFVHEFGHYYVARRFGFTILEFAIGMGPAIVKKERNGILYAIRAFPIGGMCRFYGEDEEVPEAAGKRPFAKEKVWQRALVVVAGPLMNVLLAILLAAITLMAYGDYMPEIQEFSAENTPAQTAGLQPGDMIVAVGGRDIMYYSEISDVLDAADSDETEVVVIRDGERMTFTVRDIYSEADGRNMLGVMIQAQRKSYGFFEACGHSVAYVWSIIVETVKALGGMITNGVQRGDVVGVVGMVDIMGQAIRVGFESVLRLWTLISISLAVMNLLPLPALDGGRMVFFAIEAVRGKPVPQKVEGIVHFVGLILLLGLMVLITVSDVLSLIGG